MACQAAHWNIVLLLAKVRGLQPEVVATLSQVLQTSRLCGIHEEEFLMVISEPSLAQSLLIYPTYSQIILSYIKKNVDNFPIHILQRLALQLDPSQPSSMSLINKLNPGTKISSSQDSTLENLDVENISHLLTNVKEFIEVYILVLINLVEKSNHYS